MQQAGVDGTRLILLLEDHQFIDSSFLELINSLLSSGEIPGLYSPEELEPLLAPLRDTMSQEGFRGTLFAYFCARVKRNLHIVLVMDSSADSFTANCESNPALYTHCSFQSMEGWCRQSMLRIPRLFLQSSIGRGGGGVRMSRKEPGNERPITGGNELLKAFLYIHASCRATPREYITLLKTYQAVYASKKTGVVKRQRHLQAGVSKLNEATALVDELKKKAAEQQALLAQKQTEADEALKEITFSMQKATEQKNEIEVVKHRQSEERHKLEKRKKAIDIELSEIEPLVREAKQAVGNIKPETLSEIRALRAPPEVIKDILEGVLRIMGVFDTSWGSMRSFLARRGVKEEIQNFDARKINPEIRESVQELLERNKKSFEPAVAKRASAAAAPLAVWARANVRYSYVLEKIGPLEKEQAVLMQNLEKSQVKLEKLGMVLKALDRNVKELRDRFELLTTEAAKLRIEVEREEEIIAAAGNLIGKLQGEHKRWSEQVRELAEELEQLPRRTILAAGFITYLSRAPEDERRRKLSDWVNEVGLESFDLRKFLSSESEQLVWKSEGLPSDELSIENALVILQGQQSSFLVDPSQRATEWLKCHLLKDSRLEVINQQDANFSTALELAVRFGKTLIIQEVDGVEPLLLPLLRKDLVSQGPRFVVQLGDKAIDYNESFKLFLITRNQQQDIPPHASSVITKVNFTTTRAGLTAQLLAATIHNEKPELEQRKTELLKTEEDLKVQLSQLEDSLLQELATAEGNILENKVLLESLNQTKAKSSTIAESLSESLVLQSSLDVERNSYLPLAKFGSSLFFVISDLAKLNNMYRFSLASFLRLFQRALRNKQDAGNTELRIRTLTSSLQLLTYEYVCRSLFKADRLMFAMHLVHGMRPDLFQEGEWEVFTGQLVSQTSLRRHDSIKEVIPSCFDPERAVAVHHLKAQFPTLYNNLDLRDGEIWTTFARSSNCEREFPPDVNRRLTAFQQVLVVQALRPDRLQSAMEQFATLSLGLKELSPSNLNLHRLYSTYALASEPILVVISPGADPSQEIQELAESVVGAERFHHVAMGQGQSDIAIQLLRDSALNGDWLCLKNLHLVTAWLPTLEKELNALEPHESFQLWLTTESHPKFPPILLQSSLKVSTNNL